MNSIHTHLTTAATAVAAGHGEWGLLGLRLGQTLPEARAALRGLDLGFVEAKVPMSLKALDFISQDNSLPTEINVRAHIRLTFGEDDRLKNILALVMGDGGLAQTLTRSSKAAEATAALWECVRACTAGVNASNQMTFDGIESSIATLVDDQGQVLWDQNLEDTGLSALHHTFAWDMARDAHGEAELSSSKGIFSLASEFEKAMGRARNQCYASGLRHASIGIGMAQLGDFVRPTIVATFE
ncbi:MAG: hypothetical protein O9327_04910 [Polaromonas sp.]|nr:hypothetical protein [Polaromonas sp.]